MKPDSPASPRPATSGSTRGASGPLPSGEAPDDNACTRCGACCAGMRVDFDASELESEGGTVPDTMAVPVVARLMRLRGTDHARPRCAALVGTIGVAARCGMHPFRPNPCRDFGRLAPWGIGDEACDRARRRHGLAPLERPG